MGDFFHGSEAVDVAQQLVAIAQANSGTIVLVGTAPGAEPGMELITSPVDAARYGNPVFDGRTIPHALDIYFEQGASSIVVINCIKESHMVAVAAEAIIIVPGYRFNLAHIPVGDIVVKTTGQNIVTLVKDVDYEHNDGEQFATIKNRFTYPVAANLTVDYTRFDKTAVLPADIIGGIDGSGIRTGIALLDLAYPRYELTPKIIDAPFYVESQTVCAALLLQATKLRGRLIVNSPVGATRASAIASRDTSGNYANFATVNKRIVGTFSYVYKPDPANPDTDGQPWPYSSYLAGQWSASTVTNGIKQSPSNLPLYGFTKPVTEISCGVSDRTSDASLLNAAGISVVFSGKGVRSWGNRNMSFPESQTMDTFLSVQLTQDIVDESIVMAAMAWQDKPLNQSLIDSIVSSVNVFLNTLVGSKDLIGGQASYDPAKNTPAQLATGKIVIDVTILPPPPAEQIVFQSYIDINLFSNLS